MRDIQLVKATEVDLDAIRTLAQRVWYDTYTEIVAQGQIEYMLSERYALAVLRQKLSQGDFIQLALRGEHLKGFSHAMVGEEGAGWLDKLYVDPACQHQGIGQALVSSVVDWARSLGLNGISLRVNRKNHKAIAAYHKYGFSILGQDIKQIGGGYVMDDFIMGLELAS